MTRDLGPIRTRATAFFLGLLLLVAPLPPQVVLSVGGVEYPGYVSQVVGPEVLQPRPATESQAIVFSRALQFAMDHPDDFGYPWLDAESGTLLISVASDRAPVLASEALAPMLVGTTHQLRAVQSSYGDLQRVAQEILDFVAVPGAVREGLVWQAEADHLNNRLIVSVTEWNAALLKDFGERFGPAVAVRISMRPETHPGDFRRNDPAAYLGGAEIYTPTGVCSDGFAWRNGSLWQGMLTAAHCTPAGGTVRCCNPQQTMGTVLDRYHENWVTGTGTVPYAGGSTMYRGDVALIKLAPNRSVSPHIWRGDENGSTTSVVKLVWQRWSEPGDHYYVGGRTTGDTGTYEVERLIEWHIYSDNEGVLRGAVEGGKSGDCHDGGDSGGPVFTLYDGGVAAKGIHSGGGEFFGDCIEFFTDIQHPIQQLPGGVWAAP